MADIDLPWARSGAVGRGLRAMSGTVLAWRDAYRTRNALERLSDHELEDIGLTRSEIDRVAFRHL